MALRRRQQAGGRVLGQLALDPVALREATRSDEQVIANETLDQARDAVRELPIEQQEVLRMRFTDSKTFAQIAEQLGVPLGTALTRMRLALSKLRRKLDS
jgi:RNA polymerase sigma-70 factor (ECF subfamily)